MNLKPIVPHGALKNTDPALRRFTDTIQNPARFVKTIAHNAAKIPANLRRWNTGQPPSWAPFKTNRQLRRELRNRMDQLEKDRFLCVKEGNCVEFKTGDALAALNEMGVTSMDNLHQFKKLKPLPVDGSPEYFLASEDSKVKEAQFRQNIQINPKGEHLLAKYFRRKYQANIVFPERKVAYGNIERIATSEFPAYAKEFLLELGKTNGDVRCLFYPGGTHVIPFVYLKQGDREVVLVADSKGGKSGHAALLAEQLKGTGIEVLNVAETRQRAMLGCRVDAMKFAVSLTGHRPDGEYLLPNILGALLDHASEPNDEGVRSVSLPAELLRTAQISQFVEANLKNDDKDRPLLDDPNKQRTFAEFREQYTKTFTQATEAQPDLTLAEARPKLDYLRQKAWRSAEIIQIEHFNEQLEKILGAKMWAPERQQEFATRMKQGTRPTQDDLSDESMERSDSSHQLIG
jgi:hypothetical protein